MDSHVFRILALELKKYLHGARVEKIHAPAPGLLSLTVYGQGQKRALVMRHSKLYSHGSGQVTALKGERQSPAIYLGAPKARRLPNPEKPSTLVMTLRKYLTGKRLGAATIDWLNRRIFLPVPQLSPLSKSPFPIWLCLDLLNGPRILKELPEFEENICLTGPDGSAGIANQATPDSLDTPEGGAPEPNIAPLKAPCWPDFGLLAPDHAASLQNRDLWRAYPVLTPALRKTLACLEPLEAAALLADLEYETERETGSLYLYEFAGQPHLLSAWPLPPELAENLSEIPLAESTPDENMTDETPPDEAASSESCSNMERQGPETALPGETEISSPDLMQKSAERRIHCPGESSESPLPALPPCFPGLEAARRVYEPQILAYLGASAQKEDRQAASSEKRRVAKSLQKLEQEEERLRKLAALREEGRLIQGVLWQYAPDARLDSITVETAENLAGLPPVQDGGLMQNSQPLRSAELGEFGELGELGAFPPACRTIRLDPLKTLRENMAWLFKQSDRGERGLVFIEKRRHDLESELALLESGVNPAAGMAAGSGPFGNSAGNGGAGGGRSGKSGAAGGGKGGASDLGKRPSQNAAYGQRNSRGTGKNAEAPGKDKKQNHARLVQRFTSSDGFTMLRGRSAEGNWALLKLVQPHDIWLHVEGGPSAHVVIRRESLAQDIPRRTMLEAGILSAVKSWRKTDSKAEIICALVKDVRPVKGGHPGSVYVDRIMEGFVVSVDLGLEASLQ